MRGGDGGLLELGLELDAADALGVGGADGTWAWGALLQGAGAARVLRGAAVTRLVVLVGRPREARLQPGVEDAERVHRDGGPERGERVLRMQAEPAEVRREVRREAEEHAGHEAERRARARPTRIIAEFRQNRMTIWAIVNEVPVQWCEASVNSSTISIAVNDPSTWTGRILRITSRFGPPAANVPAHEMNTAHGGKWGDPFEIGTVVIGEQRRRDLARQVQPALAALGRRAGRPRASARRGCSAVA